ncbi:tetratricopeptide repeat protein [Hymenobacter negativus]|uniref:Tetratricopeptide repeat protein n=1 Tax=Hymenobacter negativus TaxID=2795026 RepID=A0ABS3Q970_9BACT|nr:tetratricopeptide repeat protein [Hymenobacter negativus]MBO2007756.1 tetratricopeptide repeat protein [Hymenobacter negativus]
MLLFARYGVLLAGLLAGPVMAQVRSAAHPLPPLPDSLRPAAATAHTPTARLALYLRATAAFATTVDSAQTVAYAQAADALARQQADSAGVGRALSLRGFLLLQVGAPTAAAPLLHRAEKLLGEAPLRWQAANHAYLAWLLGDTDQPRPALAYLRRAHAEYGRLHDVAAQAELSGTATVVYLYQGRADSAAFVLLRAARQQHRLGRAADEANTLGNLASVLHQAGRLPEADRYAHQALAMLQARHADELLPPVYQTLGNIAWARHRPAEAVGYYRQTIRGLRQQNQEGILTSCYGSIAGAFSDLGRGDSAIYYQTLALRLCQQQGQTTQVATEMSSLAAIYFHQHRLPEAEHWAKASLAAQGTKLLQNTRALLVLSSVAKDRGDFREALRWQEKARHLEEDQYKRQSQEEVQKARAEFETDRAEQQVALLTARTRSQAQEEELLRLRARQQVALVGLLALLGLGLGIGLFVRYRRRLTARQLAHDAELRTQLAADLHDDVGSLLTQISLQSDLLRETTAAPEATLARLERLSDTSRRAARQMADVVWGLHASSAELPEVMMHMREHAYEVLSPIGLAIDFAVTEEAAALRPSVAVCQTLYLLFKEALHNAVKHAQGATQVTIRLSQDGGQLCLNVRDNAPGPAATARPGGHGLTNMRRRAEAVGGALHIVAETAGFRLVACLPA